MSDYLDYRNSFLAHHGILGQKWGIRRFQNKDGSLTSAGRYRYGIREKAYAKRKTQVDNAKRFAEEQRDDALKHAKLARNNYNNFVRDYVKPKDGWKKFAIDALGREYEKELRDEVAFNMNVASRYSGLERPENTYKVYNANNDASIAEYTRKAKEDPNLSFRINGNDLVVTIKHTVADPGLNYDIFKKHVETGEYQKAIEMLVYGRSLIEKQESDYLYKYYADLAKQYADRVNMLNTVDVSSLTKQELKQIKKDSNKYTNVHSG